MNKEEIIRRLKALPYGPDEYWLMDETAKVMRGLVRGTGMIQLGCRKETGDRLLADGVSWINEGAPAGYRQFRLDADGFIGIRENGFAEGLDMFRVFDRIDGFQVPAVSDLAEFDKLVLMSWGMDPDAMGEYCSEHYVFHYRSGSAAEKDVQAIAEKQEGYFRRICDALRVEPDFPIHYYLLNSPEESVRIAGHLSGLYIHDPDRIFAVYSEMWKAVGPHGDAYLISRLIGEPVKAVREGLASWFDRGWNGASNLSWAIWFAHTDKYLNVQDLLVDDFHTAQSELITSPLMGAFTEWLIGAFGMDKYLEFFRYKDSAVGLKLVYGKSVRELNDLFVKFVMQFQFRPDGKETMERLFRRIARGNG